MMEGKKLTALAMGNRYFKNKNYTAAISHYRQALVDMPELTRTIETNIRLAENKQRQTRYTTKYAENLHVRTESNSFDSHFYLRENPDVRAAQIDPEEHYYSFGESEGRQPNEHFDPRFYLKVNADVRQAGMSAFKHYCEFGHHEERIGKDPKTGSTRTVSPRDKTLLFVGHDGIQAGSEIVLLEIIKWYYEHTTRKIKLLLLAPGPVANLYAAYADLYVLPEYTADNADDLKEFLDEDFEFIYLNTVVSGRLFKILEPYQAPLRGSVVAHIHEMGKVLDIFSDEMQRLIRHSDLWISASPASTSVLTEKYRIPSHQIITVPAFIQPISSERTATTDFREQARKELGISSSAHVVIGCGTVYQRKGPDIFIEVARRTKTEYDGELIYLWIGDGPEKRLLTDSLSKDEKQYIKFVGNKTNASLLLAAADVFFLSSREDPFPLVVLESAQHGIPSVCYRPASGISTFIESDAGIVLDEIDTISAVRAIVDLLKNPENRDRLGKKAKEKLFKLYTAEKQILKIYSSIKNHTPYKPAVSVIVPFYNHEHFLPERFESIFNQSIKDIEIIALDDCSSDQSFRIAQNYLHDPRLTVQKNKKNSGSPFFQWRKGIDMAKSDYIWIAEGDDACEPDFLERLLPYMFDSQVNIAFARMEMMDETGTKRKNAFKPYFEKAFPGKFESSYVNYGQDEINEQLGALCTLINASGMIIRKSSFGKNLEQAHSFKMCGDWFIYLECLKHGKVAYCHDAINYFRRHSASQVHKVEGTKVYFHELQRVAEYVSENFHLSKRAIKKILDVVDTEWERFQHKHPGKNLIDVYDKRKVISNARKKTVKTMPSLMVVASDLSPGGGQLFSVRLANAWSESGGNVILVNVEKFPSHPEVLKKINSDVKVYAASDVNFNDVVNLHSVDIVHSSIWWADKYVYENLGLLTKEIKWFISMHGCYETLLKHPDFDPSFACHFPNMLHLADQWVYTAEKNREVFKVFGEPALLDKVLNGFKPEVPKPISKTDIGIREGSFVVCLASRAIESKGWFVALSAVKKLNQHGLPIELLLIGEGPAADQIEKSAPPPYIHLIGQVANLADYIALSDIGILPTTFIGESMPLVLIEFMAQGKPIVSTNVGEILNMTTDEQGSAAIILDIQNGSLSADDFAYAIQRILLDDSLRNAMASHSTRMFSRFEMEKMIDHYSQLYKRAMQ